MEIGLQKTEITYYRKHGGGVTFEADSEMVVPDVMPDIGEIIFASGIPLLRSKSLSDGRIAISGSIQSQILYIPESDPTVKKLELEIPFSYVEETSLPDGCPLTVSVRIAYTDARVLNPRKIAVRCELCANIIAYEAALLNIGSELLPRGETELCAKRESVTADFISSVSEKSFIITDSYPLAGSEGNASELLGRAVSFTVEDSRFVGTKMVLKGVIHTELIWRTEDEEIRSSSFSSEFSQIIELGELEQPNVDVTLALNGSYFELLFSASNSRTVTAELHVLAQVVGTQRREIRFVSDVYSNRHPLQLQFDAPQQVASFVRETRRDSMHGVVETPYSVCEILYSQASAGLWSRSESGFACPINVRLLLRDEDGLLHGIVRSFAAKWDGSADAAILQSVSCDELTAAPSADGVEIRMQAVAELLCSGVIQISPLASVEADDTSVLDLTEFPSVTVLPSKDGDLWSLAKRYHSTVELIEQANRELTSNVLLIPRA